MDSLTVDQSEWWSSLAGADEITESVYSVDFTCAFEVSAFCILNSELLTVYRRVTVMPPLTADARILGPPAPMVPRTSRRLLIRPLTVIG